MNRYGRRIPAMILAVMLSVIFAVPSFAGENPETENVPPAADGEGATGQHVTIKEADPGTVEPEVIAEHTPAITWELIHPDEPKPEKTDKPEPTPRREVSEPAATPKPPETETDPPETEAPETVPPETEPPETEPPETEPPETEVPETEEPDTGETETEPATEEAAAEEPETEPAEEQLPETTEAGADDPETEEPVQEEEAPAFTVTVTAEMIGENAMQLRAVVDPAELPCIYQWQISEDGGEHFTDIPEATADELRVELTEDNMDDMWRVWVQAL